MDDFPIGKLNLNTSNVTVNPKKTSHLSTLINSIYTRYNNTSTNKFPAELLQSSHSA